MITVSAVAPVGEQWPLGLGGRCGVYDCIDRLKDVSAPQNVGYVSHEEWAESPGIPV